MERAFLIYLGTLGIGISFAVVVGVTLKLKWEHLPAFKLSYPIGVIAWLVSALLHISRVGTDSFWVFVYGASWVLALMAIGAGIALFFVGEESTDEEDENSQK